MAKWMARSQGKLIKRLQLTVVPTEGQSPSLPVWVNLTLEGLEHLVELVNDKTESNRALIEEIGKLKATNDTLRRLAYGRPEGKFARGGVIPTPDRRQPIGTKPRGIDPDQLITPVPGVMITVNAPDASNGEVAENVRRTISETVQRIVSESPPLAEKGHDTPKADQGTYDNVVNLGIGTAAVGASVLYSACERAAEAPTYEASSTNTDCSSSTPSE